MTPQENKCKYCDGIYNVIDWDFHDLCTGCFTDFDNQKMRARFAALIGLGAPYSEGFEDSDEWVAYRKEL